MAEEFEKFKRFEYRMNSNLVLQRDGPGPGQNEPTGEPESLVGKLKFPMGDKVSHQAPPPSSSPLQKHKPKTQLSVREASVLDMEVSEQLSYRPSTRGNGLLYEKLLTSLVGVLGDQSENVVKGAGDEVLRALKDEQLLPPAKKKRVEHVLGRAIPETTYNELFQIAHDIDDFRAITSQPNTEDTLDDATGVAVIFEDEDHRSDFFKNQLDDQHSEDEQSITEEHEQDPTQLRYLSAKPVDEEEFAAERDVYSVEVSRIDAHWLQRELGAIYGSDLSMVVAREKEILSLLPVGDLQECETRLVLLLKYENFEFAKRLLRNRWKIYYCTRLGQSQTEKAKDKVLEEMHSHEDGREVAALLDTVRTRIDKEKVIARNVRREAASLNRKNVEESRRDDLSGSDDNFGGEDNFRGEEKGIFFKAKNIDLSSLSFSEGSHFMANEKVKLPEKSQRIEKKNYDEVIVQPSKKPENLEKKSIEILPQWARPAFESAKITHLNPIQSKVFNAAFTLGEENLLICAPTGAGKTNIALLTILNLIQQFKQNDNYNLQQFKVVYISPMKALVAEQVENLGLRLASFGMTVRELTGDVSLSGAELDQTQVIVTTPEKWDIVTRKSGERMYTQLVRLVIIDEIHLLHDTRGPVLEALVARIFRQIEATKDHVRIVGLSATLPNYECVASFLRVDLKRGLFHFDNGYRPVPMLQTYVGLKDKKAIKRFNAMNNVTYEKVIAEAGVNQCLVFVHSRRETVRTAKAIRDTAMENEEIVKFLKHSPASREILQTEAQNLLSNDAKELLPYGICIHHAGLHRTDRKLIEDLYADRHIQLLVSTATLAWGVNLPAHTVIIKGTQVYDPAAGAWTELSALDVMQMLGRGGRPQYDERGHGVLITSHSNLQFYLSLNNQQLPIESQLLGPGLADLLNAEIVCGSVRSRVDGVRWIRYTYFYVRLRVNPSLYGMCDESEDEFLTNVVHSALLILDRNHLIKYDRKGGAVQTTSLGRVAAYYYIKHPSISIYNDNLRATMTDIELLRIFSLSSEFKYIPVREEEKGELQRLIERVPIPVKGSIEESASKVNVLLQSYISRLKLTGFALACDLVYVQHNAVRIMRAIFEICLRRGWADLACKSLRYCKMVENRIWLSMTPLRQFRGVPEDLLRKLEKKDFPWARYYDLTPTEIGELVRVPKLGKVLYKLVHQFPKVDLAAYVQPLTRSCLLVELTICTDFQWENKIHGNSLGFWIFIEDGDSESILHYEYLIAYQNITEYTISLTVPITEPLPPHYYIRAVSDRWLHSEALMPVSFQALILPEKNPPHTELLDLQPLPVSGLKDPILENIYKEKVKKFNPIQTQVFSAFFHTSDNLLLCAPHAVGKTLCAEFAILRKLGSTFKSVYIAPLPQMLKLRLKEWTIQFKNIPLKIQPLSGNVPLDLKILENNDLVLATPEQWEFVTRRWKTRKVLQNIDLFIVDDLQLLDSEKVGATLEVCVSRMRYISAHLPQPIRIVGLACSLANAKDVAEWLGTPPCGMFNFNTNSRPVPLEISIHGFDLSERTARVMAMAKPLYQGLKVHLTSGGDKWEQPGGDANKEENKEKKEENKEKKEENEETKEETIPGCENNTIIFVSDRKLARLTAFDLILQAAADTNPKRFLHTSLKEMQRRVSGIEREKGLEETLRSGVGYLHEGMREEETELVQTLFSQKKIQVLIVTAHLAWGLPLSAKLVVIMDTKYSTNNGWADYSMTDMLQMVGRATRTERETQIKSKKKNAKNVGIVLLLTHVAKKDFYKKFFSEPLPVESRLDQRIADFLNAEVVLKTIENKQDAIDWMTWTFYYRRLTKNPNYYGLQGITHEHISDHMSELIESTVENLDTAGCLAVKNEVALSPLNFGLIASFYYVRYTTIELFNKSLSATTKRRGLLDILASATEFENLPVRKEEQTALKKLVSSLSVPLAHSLDDPHSKTLILLYAHFARCPLSTDMAADQKMILELSLRLVQTLVDVISSNGWLKPEIVAMEISQMLVQASSPSQSPLKQIPHFDQTRIEAAEKMGVMDVYDVINLETEGRQTLFGGLGVSETRSIARMCNLYPIINLEYQFLTGNNSITQQPFLTKPAANLTLNLKISRDLPEGCSVGHVLAPYYPGVKEEFWWGVVGEPGTNCLSSIRRFAFGVTKDVKLTWTAPETCGEYSFILYLVSDSYFGCDQEFPFKIRVS